MVTHDPCKHSGSTYYTINASGVGSSFQPFQPPTLQNVSHFTTSSINGSIYMPSTIHPIHSMPVQLGYKSFGVPLPHSGGYNMNRSFIPGSINMLGGDVMGEGPSVHPMSSNWGTESLLGIPFLATLNLPYLSNLTNDLVVHLPHWPPIPTKLPSGIPKFEGELVEDPSNHIMTFHVWCSSNSLVDDSIILWLF
jgi:hypothetical protein